jgi:hypothetical protein
MGYPLNRWTWNGHWLGWSVHTSTLIAETHISLPLTIAPDLAPIRDLRRPCWKGEGRMKWLNATDSVAGKSERLTLAQTLKSVWKIVPAPGGTGSDILQALCRPAFQPGDDEFKLIYIRYHFDGKRWVQMVRESKGYSDFEDGFPGRSLFP